MILPVVPGFNTGKLRLKFLNDRFIFMFLSKTKTLPGISPLDIGLDLKEWYRFQGISVGLLKWDEQVAFAQVHFAHASSAGGD